MTSAPCMPGAHLEPPTLDQQAATTSSGVATSDPRVLVVGASVAGSVAALSLARAGIRVTVVERHALPWDKVCGEGIHPAGLHVLEPLIGPLDPDGSPFRGFCFRTPETADLVWRFPATHRGLGVDRTVLTRRLLAALASEPRVELRLGVTLTGLVPFAGSWRATLEDGESIDRAYVVGADGVASRVRRWAGLERGDLHGRWGARRRYRLAQPYADRVTIQFLGHGEVYLTPLAESRLSVAILGDREWILGLREPGAFERLLRSAQSLPEGADAEDRVAILPHQGHRSVQVATRGLYLAGDAARFLDPITGAGMTLACLGGALAAEAIHRAEAGHPAAAVEKWYARELHRSLAPFVGLEKFLRGVGRASWLRRIAVTGLTHVPWVISHLARPTYAPRARATARSH